MVEQGQRNLHGAREVLHMRTRLGAAREQSRRFFWRVQLPALVFAALSQVAALCAVGIIAFSGHRDLSGVYIGLVLFGVGGFAICFAAEPWMARPAACSLCFCSAAASSIFAYLFVLYARSAPELLRAHRAGLGVVCRMVEDGQTIPCGLMPTMAVTAYAPALAMHFFVAANVRNVWRERMLPREVLEGMVRTGGYMYVLIALSSATRLATAAAYGVPVGSLLWKSTAACAVVVGALGVLMLAGVHEFMLGLLAQRGQAFSTAAGIAALLDGRDSTVVQALAVSRLRAVSAAAVTLEGLGSNTANVEFYALRAPASLGHVDAFVSHSWHDPPARKFDALQAWRADFLLILAGPTWLSRLWCIVELMSWGQMHATSAKDAWDRVDVVDIAPPDASKFLPRCAVPRAEMSRLSTAIRGLSMGSAGSGARRGSSRRSSVAPSTSSTQLQTFTEQLANFDVRHAVCELEADYARLMPMIEASAGSFDSFNTTVRSGLLARMAAASNALAHPSRWRRASSLFGLDGPGQVIPIGTLAAIQATTHGTAMTASRQALSTLSSPNRAP
ncbi:hypothetical protein KFE25_006738 [Diacronema lutheri]|uniref:Uncharacterized protein n=1 Tax=Diacronema lutheri TaxID=2081491 RepID=A0A8J5XRG3_DIALT|nr:hypothetical protein KFE25_006738 [Diacronema lutheri]